MGSSFSIVSNSDTVRVILQDTPHTALGLVTSPVFISMAGIFLLLAFIFRANVLSFFKKIKPTGYVVKIPGFEVDGGISYYSEDQVLAWKIYVELATRVSTNTLRPNSGIMREALTSLYTLFGILRETLKNSGPLKLQPRYNDKYTVASLLLDIMNEKLRPFLSEWHPKLQKYEAKTLPDVPQVEREKGWPEEEKFRAALTKLAEGLDEYKKQLGIIIQND